MSRLSEMIKELCPDGGEYRKLGEIAYYVKERIKVSDVDACNYVGVEHLRQDTKGRETSEALPDVDSVIAFRPEDILIGNIRPYLKKAWLADCHGGTNGDVLTIRIDDKRHISPRYLFYILSSERFFTYDMKYAKGTKMPRGDKKAVMNYEIPVPPLPIQNEIVKLLDNFTELTAELTAELLLRKKQYNFYRDSLLNFVRVDDTIVQTERKTELGIGKVVSFLLLSELAEIGTGGSNTNEGLSEGTYPFFVRSQEVRWKNTYEYDETAIITSGDGVGVGKIFHYIEGKYALHQRAYRIHVFDERLLPKFLFYYMKASFYRYITQNAVQSSVTSIRRPMLNKYPIPIPPLEVQQKIVSILDRFETLTSDLTQGLPAEIAARRKQYEYYRDKLLTFPRKAV